MYLERTLQPSKLASAIVAYARNVDNLDVLETAIQKIARINVNSNVLPGPTPFITWLRCFKVLKLHYIVKKSQWRLVADRLIVNISTRTATTYSDAQFSHGICPDCVSKVTVHIPVIVNTKSVLS